MNICKKNSLYTYVNTASDMAKYSTIVYVHVHQVDTATEETPAVLSSLCINLCTYAAIANTALLNHRRLVQPMLDQPRLDIHKRPYVHLISVLRVFNSSRYPPAPHTSTIQLQGSDSPSFYGPTFWIHRLSWCTRRTVKSNSW